jgi:hypothetical protein
MDAIYRRLPGINNPGNRRFLNRKQISLCSLCQTLVGVLLRHDNRGGHHPHRPSSWSLAAKRQFENAESDGS